MADRQDTETDWDCGRQRDRQTKIHTDRQKKLERECDRKKETATKRQRETKDLEDENQDSFRLSRHFFCC